MMIGTCSTEDCGHVGTLVTGNGGQLVCRTCDLWQGRLSELEIYADKCLEDATLAANEGALEFQNSLGLTLTEPERVWVVDTLYVIGRHLLDVHKDDLKRCRYCGDWSHDEDTCPNHK